MFIDSEQHHILKPEVFCSHDVRGAMTGRYKFYMRDGRVFYRGRLPGQLHTDDLFSIDATRTEIVCANIIVDRQEKKYVKNRWSSYDGRPSELELV